MYEHFPSRLIDMGIDGFSTTVFCYGQTGSGKTHTLTGPPYLVSFAYELSRSSQYTTLNHPGESINRWKINQRGRKMLSCKSVVKMILSPLFQWLS